MAVAFVLDFEGATSAQYHAVVEDMHLGGKTAPGGLYHGAGNTANGLRVIDVWESDAVFEEFARTKIGPLTQKHGMPEPKIERFEVAEVRRGSEPGAEAHFAQVVRLESLTAEQFHALDETVVPGGRMPDGVIFHVNGTTDGGFFVIDYWASREQRDTFLATQVGPASAAAGYPPPAIEDLDLFATMVAAGTAVNA
jgi:hypothetical protein